MPRVIFPNKFSIPKCNKKLIEGAQKKCFNDTLKQNLELCNIVWTDWKEHAWTDQTGGHPFIRNLATSWNKEPNISKRNKDWEKNVQPFLINQEVQQLPLVQNAGKSVYPDWNSSVTEGFTINRRWPSSSMKDSHKSSQSSCLVYVSYRYNSHTDHLEETLLILDSFILVF